MEAVTRSLSAVVIIVISYYLLFFNVVVIMYSFPLCTQKNIFRVPKKLQLVPKPLVNLPGFPVACLKFGAFSWPLQPFEENVNATKENWPACLPLAQPWRAIMLCMHPEARSVPAGPVGTRRGPPSSEPLPKGVLEKRKAANPRDNVEPGGETDVGYD